MSDIEVYRFLKRFGYLPGVSYSDVERLDRSSADTRNAVEKLQLFYDSNSVGAPDGIIGPKTLAAMAQPRCMHPDFADHELAKMACSAGASAAPEIPLADSSEAHDLNTVAEALGLGFEEACLLAAAHARLEAIGQGSWPMPCQKEGVMYTYDTSAAPRSVDTERLIRENVAAYNAVGVKLVEHLPSHTGHSANIRISWRPLQGSVIGLAEFNNQSCSDSVFCYLDPDFHPSHAMVAELLCHELGHNMNLQHTRGGIMNPTIVQISSFDGWKPSDPSYPVLTRFFGGEPIDPNPPGPDPNPPNPLPPGELHGIVVVDGRLFNITGKRA